MRRTGRRLCYVKDTDDGEEGDDVFDEGTDLDVFELAESLEDVFDNRLYLNSDLLGLWRRYFNGSGH